MLQRNLTASFSFFPLIFNPYGMIFQRSRVILPAFQEGRGEPSHPGNGSLFFVSQIAERGRPCRKSKDLCDFPEFCNGFSEYCVPDTMAADLEPCNNKTAYCFGGICRDLDRQCMDLFGKRMRCSFVCLFVFELLLF